MNWINKMERKLGKYAIRNLMLYIILLYGAGFVLNLINPLFFPMYLSFDVQAILQGQVWRVFTFLLQPPADDLLYFMLAMYLYYMLGTNLEYTWGAFRFNLYFFMGVLGHVLAGFLIYFLFDYNVFLHTTFLNMSLFFAYAAVYPDLQFLLFFVIPIKAKWLGLAEGAIYMYMFVTGLLHGDYATVILIGLSLLNFVLFFLMTRNLQRFSPKQVKRKMEYKSQVRAAVGNGKTSRHKCAVCGRTEADGEDLVFRFCSKCEGEYEYCQDHLYTHQHVKKGM